jgi:hypothetical protein
MLQVRLKGVAESFRYVHSMLGRQPESPGIGNDLVKALREVGNHIPAAAEPEYARVLSEMFTLYCSVGLSSRGPC